MAIIEVHSIISAFKHLLEKQTIKCKKAT